MGNPGVELQPIDGNVCVFKARIPDEDMEKPIRRIFPLWILQRTVRLRQLTLVPPSMWEDPHEDPVALCMLAPDAALRAAGRKNQQNMAAYLTPAWAQCWSLNPGSDTLMRAYSRVTLDPLERRNMDPRNEGVAVTTTPRRLMAAMKTWADTAANSHFVLGGVRYLAEAELRQQIANIVGGSLGPAFYRSVQGRGESLLWKRDFFKHEEEVRLICIERDSKHPSTEVRAFQVDPNELFTDISFDPRLVSFEQKEREAEIRRLGYEGSVTLDNSYANVLSLIEVSKDWPDP